jgi:predicted GNAT superfamily acetyltransferase
LKAEQRAWCLANRIDEVTWTFDPMLARNAYFNLRKLGAAAFALLPNFYGAMDDAVNGGDETDRLEVHWQLSSDRVTRAAGGDKVPVDARDVAMTVAVPADYAALRRADPASARAERERVRDALSSAFSDGLVVVDFNDRGEYCLAPARRDLA